MDEKKGANLGADLVVHFVQGARELRERGSHVAWGELSIGGGWSSWRNIIRFFGHIRNPIDDRTTHVRTGEQRRT